MRLPKLAVAVTAVMTGVVLASGPAAAGPLDEYADIPAGERVECLVIMTFDEGHNWQDCLN